MVLGEMTKLYHHHRSVQPETTFLRMSAHVYRANIDHYVNIVRHVV